VPLEMPTAIAQRHGYSSATNCGIPACLQVRQPRWTFPSSTRRGHQRGYVRWPVRDIAATCSPRPVTPRPRSSPRQGTEGSRIASVFTASSPRRNGRAPRPHLPACSRTARRVSTSPRWPASIVGILIALNTILLAVEDRRFVDGTIGAIAPNRSGCSAGCSARSVVGLLGGLLGVPSGFLLGMYWWTHSGDPCWPVRRQHRRHFTPNLLVMGAAAGSPAESLR